MNYITIVLNLTSVVHVIDTHFPLVKTIQILLIIHVVGGLLWLWLKHQSMSESDGNWGEVGCDRRETMRLLSAVETGWDGGGGVTVEASTYRPGKGQLVFL